MSYRACPLELLQLLSSCGDTMYGGEEVTQLEHALQAAWLAEQHGASPELITAALLHDIGHLVSGLSDELSEHLQDDRHEHRALELLQALFPTKVTEPIRMHVDAKRYLCTVDPSYESTLSSASIVSLKLQGGRMSEVEVQQFSSHPHLPDALSLRSWDDQAKIPGLETPPLSHFKTYVEQAAK